MFKLLLPFLLLIGVVAWFKLRAQMSGHALRRQSKVLEHAGLLPLFERLADAAGIDGVEVRVLPDRNPNGLATDTGEIYVTQGFIDCLDRGEVSRAEIASVAAHEMGHVALGHMKRRMMQVAGTQAAYFLLARLIPFVGTYVAMLLDRIVSAKLSQRDEFEADAYATALMIRSGLGAEHQATLLEKLPHLIPGAGDARNWLASHPPVDQRAAAIRGNAARWAHHEPPDQIRG